MVGKFFGGLTVQDTKTGAYYRILGFSSYKTEKKLFHKPVTVVLYELVELGSELHIEVSESDLEKHYHVM